MSHPTPYPAPPTGAAGPANQPPTHQYTPSSSTNSWAIAALVIGIITFCTGFVPLFTLLWGLPGIVIAVIGIKKSAQYGSGRGLAIAGLVLSIIGALTSLVLGIGLVAAFSEEGSTVTTVAADETPTTSSERAAEQQDPAPDKPAEEKPAADKPADDAQVGTRENPAPLTTSVSTDDWKVGPSGPIDDITAAALGANPFNEDPAAGNKYWKVPLTITYTGDDPAGSTPLFEVDADLVGPDGNSFESKFVVLPDGMQSVSDVNTMFNGATEEAVVVIEAPADIREAGVLAIRIGIFDEKVTFFATK